MAKLNGIVALVLAFLLLFLAGCGGGKGGGSASASAVIPETTKVLDSSTTAKIASVSTDQSALVFTDVTPQLAKVKVGDIIVSNTNEKTPEGMLRKVTAIQQNPDGTTTVSTVPAALEEAVKDGEFSMSTKLGPADVVTPAGAAKKEKVAAAEVGLGSFDISIDNVVLHDDDGDSATTGDQVTANGFVRLDPSIDISGKIKDFRVERFNFSAKGVESSQITISAAVPLPSFDKRVLVKELDLGTRTMWIGSAPLAVPVVVQIKLAVYVGIKGDVSLGVSVGVTQESTFTAGVKYENNAWAPVKEFTNAYGVIPPQLSAAASVKCYAGPELSLKFYGVAGPYANINGYLLLEASPLNTPWWELWCGVEANAGAKLEIEGSNISVLFKDFNVNMRYDVNLLDYKESLARASTPYVRVGTVSGRVTLNGSGLSGATITISGSGSGSAITDSNGGYSFANVANGTYSISVTKAGYNFTPSSINNMMVNGADVINQDFTATAIQEFHSLSGTIHSGNNTGPVLSGATVSIAGKTATTSSTGTFSITGIPAGTYAFSVFKSGYDTFTNPAYYVGSDQTGLNFYLTQSAGPYYSIGGTIHAESNSGAALPGATVSIAGRTATTSSAGTFSITGIPAGTYAFSVSKAGYETYTNPAYYVGSNQSGKNYYLTMINSSLVCTHSSGTSINGIQFTGNTSYQLSTTAANATETATLTWEVYYQNIFNLPTGSYSGSLRARLWAVPYSFSGGTITNSHVLGTFTPNFTGPGAYSPNQVYVGAYSISPVSNSVSGQNPPPGTYCIVVTLEEYNTLGGCSDPSGYCYEHLRHYSSPVTFR